jgi:hypothetical protein
VLAGLCRVTISRFWRERRLRVGRGALLARSRRRRGARRDRRHGDGRGSGAARACAERLLSREQSPRPAGRAPRTRIRGRLFARSVSRAGPLPQARRSCRGSGRPVRPRALPEPRLHLLRRRAGAGRRRRARAVAAHLDEVRASPTAHRLRLEKLLPSYTRSSEVSARPSRFAPAPTPLWSTTPTRRCARSSSSSPTATPAPSWRKRPPHSPARRRSTVRI